MSVTLGRLILDFCGSALFCCSYHGLFDFKLESELKSVIPYTRNTPVTYDYKSGRSTPSFYGADKTLSRYPRHTDCVTYHIVLLRSEGLVDLFSTNQTWNICDVYNDWYILIPASKIRTPLSFKSREFFRWVKNALWVFPSRLICLVRHQWVELPVESSTSEQLIKRCSSMYRDFQGDTVYTIPSFGVPLGPLSRLLRLSILRNSNIPTSCLHVVDEFTRRINATGKLPKMPRGPPTKSAAETTLEYDQAILGTTPFSRDYFKILSPTTPAVMHYTTFIAPLPKVVQHDSGAGFLFQPLGVWVWLALFLSYVLVVVTIGFKKKLDFAKDFALEILKPLLDQPPTLSVVKEYKDQVQIMLTTWLFLVFLVSSFYKCCMTSFIVSPVLISPPTTFRDLLNSNFKLYLGGLIPLSFHALNESLASKGNQQGRIEVIPFDPRSRELRTKCHRMVLQGDNVCISDDSFLQFGMQESLIDVYGKQKCPLMKESYMPTSMGSPVSPYSNLKPLLDLVTIRMVNGGFTYLWFHTLAYFMRIGAQSEDRMVENQNSYDNGGTEEVDDNGYITLQNLKTSFYIYLVGVGLASAFFFMECLPKKLRRTDTTTILIL